MFMPGPTARGLGESREIKVTAEAVAIASENIGAPEDGEVPNGADEKEEAPTVLELPDGRKVRAFVVFEVEGPDGRIETLSADSVRGGGLEGGGGAPYRLEMVNHGNSSFREKSPQGPRTSP